MKSAIALTAAALTLAAPALAEPQLARSLGVEPGAYTNVELIQLRRAIEENDDQLIELITGGDVARTVNGASAGQAQLARSLGVEPGAYSTSDLIALRSALEENDDQRVRDITNTDVVSTQNGVSPGQAQLASTLGVDADAHTTASLALLYLETFNDTDD